MEEDDSKERDGILEREEKGVSERERRISKEKVMRERMLRGDGAGETW